MSMRMQTSGTFTWFGFTLPMGERLRMIRDAGFQSVCSWWGPEFRDTDGDYRGIPDLCASAGLELENCHLPYHRADLLWEDTLDAVDALRDQRALVTQAGAAGVARLVMHPHEKSVPVDGRRLFMDNLCRIGEEASKRGVKIALENLSDPGELERILLSCTDAAVGLCFDSGHANISSPGDFSLLQTFAGRLLAVHMHDNDTTRDTHSVPYDGTVDWHALALAVAEGSYAGPFMLESVYPFDWDAVNETYESPPAHAAPAFLERAHLRCRAAIDGKDRGFLGDCGGNS